MPRANRRRPNAHLVRVSDARGSHPGETGHLRLDGLLRELGLRLLARLRLLLLDREQPRRLARQHHQRELRGEEEHHEYGANRGVDVEGGHRAHVREERRPRLIHELAREVGRRHSGNEDPPRSTRASNFASLVPRFPFVRRDKRRVAWLVR